YLSDKIDISDKGIKITGELSENEWFEALSYCNNMSEKIQWVIGELLIYGEKKKYRKYEEMIASSNYKYQTLRNIKSVTERVELSRRQDSLTFSHHQEVAKLEPEKQKEFLDRASDERLSVRELRSEIRKDSLTDKVPEFPKGKYRIIYADPPWQYNDKQDISALGGATKHYPTMSIPELCSLPVPSITDQNAVLFLWVTSPFLEDSFQVINAWGFKYRTSIVWDKDAHNMGHYVSVRHEFLLICVQGSCTPDTNKLFHSVVTLKRDNIHSHKPEFFREMIDRMYFNGNKIDLFARTKPTDQWEVWGNQCL
ncbi:MAG: hypothetical protein DRI84_09090, partial [Bacteroidetes bacterium]